MSNILDIIIPIYNTPEEYLVRALNSINKQRNLDFKSVNVIVVDDASKKIKYKKSWFKQRFPKLHVTNLFNEENVGPGVTRQHGIDAGDGKYITFLDSDDEFVGFESIKNIIECLIQFNLDKLSTSVNEEVVDERDVINIKHDSNSLQSLHALYLKRDFLTKNNIKFDDKLRRYEDLYYLTIVNAMAGESQAFVDEITYNWKWNQQSMMRNSMQKYPDLEAQIYALTKSLEFLDKKVCSFDKNYVSNLLIICSIINSNILDLPEYFHLKKEYLSLFDILFENNKNKFDNVGYEFVRKNINLIIQSLNRMYPWVVLNDSFKDFINRLEKTYGNKQESSD